MEVKDVLLDTINLGDRSRADLGDVEGLANSIREFGVLQPITIYDNYLLVAGGRRVEAARLAGLESIPAVVRAAGDEADLREIELVENVQRKDLTWQERAKLEKRLYELKGSVQAAADEAGRSTTDLHRHVELAGALEVIPDLAKYKTQDDAWKALKKIEEGVLVKEIAKRAKAQAEEQKEDLPPGLSAFQLGQSNYKIGDAIEGLAECNEGIFHLAEVDPPYGIGLEDMKRRGSEVSTVDDYTEVPDDLYSAFLLRAATGVYRVLGVNAFCIWWFGPTNYTAVKAALEAAKFTVCDVPAIWNKGAQGQTQQPNYNLANCYEPFFVCRKGNPHLAVQGRSNVFDFPPVAGASKIHATERPLDLMVELLRVFAYPGQRVVVPFLGSGVTLRACYKMDMAGCGWDLNEDVKNKFLLQLKGDAEGG
jgi:ParB/RepB/Spo0J family partition protein